jgi:hypothetical protein
VTRAGPDAEARGIVVILVGLGAQRPLQSTGYHPDRCRKTGTFPPPGFEVFELLEPVFRGRRMLHDTPLMIEGQDARDVGAVPFDGRLRA